MPSDEARKLWFAGYVQTYLERDLRQLSAVSSLPDFQRLMALAAWLAGIKSQPDLANRLDQGFFALPWGWLAKGAAVHYIVGSGHFSRLKETMYETTPWIRKSRFPERVARESRLPPAPHVLTVTTQ